MPSNAELRHTRHPNDTHGALPPLHVDLIERLSRRRRAPTTDIAGAMEDSFLNDFDSVDYDLNPTLVKSTIAIALSPDGNTVATTHGDHTVKIFRYADATLFRVFEGHPRTPWTVKYHHTNADIVASGCLGFEIFVWSISENCKVNSIRYRNSIISLSFQPHGPFIAIASGTELRLWNWAEHANLCIDGPTGNIIQSKSRPDKAFDATATPSRQYPSMKVIFHQRNIRAVLFHPYGKILLAAAPDYSKSKNASYNRLYAFDIDSIAIPPGDPIDQESDGHMLSLSTLPSLLPQVHLYSDGGLDISSDGQFLFVCSILFEGKAVDSTLDALTQRLTAMSLSTDDDFSTQQLVSIDPDTVDAAGLAPIPCLCLYKFNFPVECSTKINDKVPESAIGFRNAALYDIPYPQLELIRHNQLSSSLLKAITSVKLSPACRYGLLGYGVRNEGYVESHIYGYVASEIVSLWDQKLPIVAAMTDEVDEVNIAQFHPLPGGGIIYGTKRGRVRVFKRTSIIKG